MFGKVSIFFRIMQSSINFNLYLTITFGFPYDKQIIYLKLITFFGSDYIGGSFISLPKKQKHKEKKYVNFNKKHFRKKFNNNMPHVINQSTELVQKFQEYLHFNILISASVSVILFTER